MASLIDCINNALDLIGEPGITALDDPSLKAGICRRQQDSVLQSMLTKVRWNFNYSRIQLAADSEVPEGVQFQYAYTLPPDYLQIHGIGNDPRRNGAPDSFLDWSVEQGKITTDAPPPLTVHYARLITDPNKWQPSFRLAFECLLANRLSHAIPNSAADAKELFQEYQSHLTEAEAEDGLEHGIVTYESPDLIECRGGGGFGGMGFGGGSGDGTATANFSATLVRPCIPYADSTHHLNVDASLTWNVNENALELLGISRFKMAGGFYNPAVDGLTDFVALTAGSTRMGATTEGLRRATWSFFDTNQTDEDNATIMIDVVAPVTPVGTYKKTGLHIKAYTRPDNGGDTSGILAVQTGGGNAISAFHLTRLRPVGYADYTSNGYAIECGSDDANAAMLLQVGLNSVGPYTQGLLVNLNSATARGIVFQPTSPASFDGRLAIEIAQAVAGGANLVPTYQLSLAGSAVHNAFTGGVLSSQALIGPVETSFSRKVNDANPYVIHLYKDRVNAALQNNDTLHTLSIEGITGSTLKQMAGWYSSILDVTDGSEDATQVFQCMRAGTLEISMQLNAPGDTETSLLLLRNVGGSFTLQRVSMGTDNSGGSGYKLLRVAN